MRRVSVIVSAARARRYARPSGPCSAGGRTARLRENERLTCFSSGRSASETSPTILLASSFSPKRHHSISRTKTGREMRPRASPRLPSRVWPHRMRSHVAGGGAGGGGGGGGGGEQP